MQNGVSTKEIDCIGGDGKIVISALKKFLEDNYMNRDTVFHSRYAKMKFADFGGIVAKMAEDSFFYLKSLIDIIVRTEEMSPRGRELLNKLTNACGTAFIGFRNLSELTYNEKSGGLSLRLIELKEFVSKFVSELGSLLPEDMCGNIRVINGARNKLMCAAESSSLTLILVNLLLNALIHSRTADNRVDIVVTRQSRSKCAAVSVIDYGIGIDSGKIYRAIEGGIINYGNGFGGFKNYNGCGLLASQKLADLMGAKILMSNVSGGGAMFTVMLSDPQVVEKYGYNVICDSAAETSSPDLNLIKMAFLGIISNLNNKRSV